MTAALEKCPGYPDLRDTEGLCLLSLDGGGVRGLSSLYILKGLMRRLNDKRQIKQIKRKEDLKPCEVFDLIGGTSTGGLIAIMLGRLEMDVDECITAYQDLMKRVFTKGVGWNPSMNIKGERRARFDSEKLSEAIMSVLNKKGCQATDLLNDGQARGCRVFVCATAKDTKNAVLLRSYSPTVDWTALNPTVLQAALATSAAPTFFEGVTIDTRTFIDGGLRNNNPVDRVENEASDIWCPKTANLKCLVKCFISIGTGHLGKEPVHDNFFKFLAKTALEIATETEDTAEKFIQRWRGHLAENRYFRFNVQQGLHGIGLEEYKRESMIKASAEEYLGEQEQRFKLDNCVENLATKKTKTDTDFDSRVNDLRLHTSPLDIIPPFDHCEFSDKDEKFDLDWAHGTCQWMTQESEFAIWNAETNCKILWLFGKAGSGKSFMANFIYRWLVDTQIHATQHNSKTVKFVLRFFFDSKGGRDRDNLRWFYPTLLHQLLLQAQAILGEKERALCLKIIRKSVPERNQTNEDFKRAIRGIMAEVGSSYLIIDSLDECKVQNGPDVLHTWLVEQDMHPGLKTLITSRPEQRIKDVKKRRDHLGLHMSLDLNNLAEKSNEDISKLIQHQFDTEEALKGESERWAHVRDKIRRELMQKADGMILYVSLMLGVLKELDGDELEKRLDELPRDIEDIYQKRLAQIEGSNDQHFAKEIFQWLIIGRRSLKLDGLAKAMVLSSSAAQDSEEPEVGTRNVAKNESSNGTDFFITSGCFGRLKDTDEHRFRRRLIKACHPVVEVLDDTTVHIVHTTFAEYLLHETTSVFRISPMRSHGNLAHLCLLYLHVVYRQPECIHGLSPMDGSGTRKVPETRKPNPSDQDDLGSYAVSEWPEHSTKSQNLTLDDDRRDTLLLFCEKRTFSNWIQSRQRMDYTFRVHFALEHDSACQPTALHIAAYFDLQFLGQSFLHQTNEQDVTGSTPLHTATERNHRRIIQVLLGNRPWTDRPDVYGTWALHKAARRGHTAATQELVSGGADVSVKDRCKFTPLHVACQLGWIDCVKILLGAPAKTSIEPDAIETPLGLAISNGHKDVVKIILDADRTLIESCGKPLVRACRRGQLNMVKLLCERESELRRNADATRSLLLDERDFMRQTALHKACMSGNEHLVEYLLDCPGIEIDVVDNSDRTPLYFAAERGHFKIVELLVQKRANVNHLDRRRETVMFKPAGNGHTSIVLHLLQSGTDPTKLDLWSRSPLRFAALKGRKDIVRLLLDETDIDPNMPDWMNRPVFHVAAASLREGQEDILDMLMEPKHRPMPGIRGFQGGNALHAAIFREPGHPPPTQALLKKLIDYDVPLDVKDDLGRSPLTCAVLSRNPGITKLLLESGAPVDHLAFHNAVESGDAEIVQLFLSQKGKLHLQIRNHLGETVLHVAARKGHDEIVLNLLKARISTRSLDMEKRTALVRAHGLGNQAMSSLKEATEDYEKKVEKKAKRQTWTSRDDLGQTIIHKGILWGSATPEIVEKYISEGVKVELRDELGQTALIYAAEAGNVGVCKKLLSVGADINSRDHWERSSLHLAAHRGHDEVVRELLSHGAWIQTDSSGRTPFHNAAAAGHGPVILELLNRHDTPEALFQQDGIGDTALHLAVDHRQAVVVGILLQNRAIQHPQPGEISGVNARNGLGQTALHIASRNGDSVIVQELLGAGALAYLIDRDRFMPIHGAAEHGHIEIVRMLHTALSDQVGRLDLHPGHPIPSHFRGSGFNAVLSALFRINALQETQDGSFTYSPKHDTMVELQSQLHKWEDDAHSVPSTALSQAVKGGHMDVTKFLLEAVPGIASETPDYDGFNPLQQAARRGYESIASLLIETGIRVNAFSDRQEVCLHVAAEHGNVEVVDILLKEGALIDLARYRDGRTALHLAAEKGHTRVVKSLVRSAFINAMDDDGQTPLHLATYGGMYEVVDLLLAAGADVLIEDLQRQTPLMVAIERKHDTICRQLQKEVNRQRARG